MAMKAYTVVLSKNPGSNWYSVSCPALPGAISQGRGKPETLRNIQEAMEGWLEVSLENDTYPLEETPEVIAEWIREILQDRAEEGWDLLVETALVTPQVAVPAA